MKKQLLAAAVTCGMLATIGTPSTPAAAQKGNAYGYWAGRLCDHVGPTTAGVTYWESRGYSSRGECVQAEGRSLRNGEWNPDTLDPVTYPI